ncbi:MAG: ABC transporter permease [Dehalococcoidia bacterium]|jgi:peptide/nickel transport system permease protein|nr:ABC transporter permease [Dehalococcoidia bacterium]MDW8009309.1 ABC transporter permease [Chloroflexota bacterium]
MWGYIMRRVGLLVPTLALVTVLVALLVRLLPGDAVEIIIGQYTPLTHGDREAVRRQLGLDKPWYEQYGEFVGGVFTGDWGTSLQSQQPIGRELARRLPVTFELGLLALLISIVVAVPVGVIAAIRQDRWLDYLMRGSAIVFIAVPAFWLGTLVVVLPNVWWGWAPPIHYESFFDDPLSNLYFMIIPASILGLGLSGSVMRLTRTQMLEVLRQDYIRTAWAKGLRERAIILRHALRNALIPVTTLIGLQVPLLVGGTVVLETIFSVPGIGSYLVTAVNSRDYPVVQAVNLVVALAVVLSNLLVDVLYAYLDPRIRYA